ncbi:hypothetical protein ACGFIK_00830 [Micromonospora sp. NPDC048871]|uniref:hypothetical protein n=1 Tax=Micromonospora sp. NPDC048871 TaxID=3364259 RepID=UPI00371320B7
MTQPRRLVYTELFDDQSYPGETVVDHDFTELAGRTTVTTTLRFATPAGGPRSCATRWPAASPRATSDSPNCWRQHWE